MEDQHSRLAIIRVKELAKERHASDYAIVYDENDQNENIKPLSGVTFADTTYTGKPQSIKITGVSADSVDDVKVPADAYEITGVTTQTNAGTYQFTLTAKEGSGFRGSTVGTWKINKGKTSFSVKGATVKAKKLKNKKQAVTVKVSNLSTGSSKPTYAIKKVTKGQKKKVKINKKTGKVTLKKGCKKCKITVVATSKANANCEKATATAEIVVK
ncbi:hypothetical protein SAMN02910400_00518 [Lachnospiraceae bacterium C10]|nr:hypothetical protein SAMN02910400_00518 [Lachnospiraceae bacterium C10]